MPLTIVSRFAPIGVKGSVPRVKRVNDVLLAACAMCYDTVMEIHPLPTTEPRAALQTGLDARAPWFYALAFDNGAQTPGESATINAIHRARYDAIFPHLDRLFAGRWPSVRCLDLACHEGWFALHAAMRGAAVRGVDIRPDHIAKARWLADQTGLPNVRFTEGDLFVPDDSHADGYDLLLFIGIFYHLEDPMRALRIARSLTRGVCVLEGTVARAATMEAVWGPDDLLRRGPGAIILPADEVHTGSGGGITLVPSLDGLRTMLLRAWFAAVHLALPTEGDPPVYGDRDRVIVFAYT